MKATGIVRRIDDLGRVVVPKEIRRTLRLREGTPLEIFTDREGEIILKKYSPMMELNAFAGQYADAMAQSTGLLVCITDRDQVVAAAGGAKKDFFQKPISRALEHVIEERTVIQAGKEDRNFTPVTDDDGDSITAQVITPIICHRSRHYHEPRAARKIFRSGTAPGGNSCRFPRAADGKLRKRRDLKRQEFHPLIKL